MTRENLAARLQGVEARDTQAARLLSQHGAALSRLVRLYLTDPHLCRLGDAPAPGQTALMTTLERVAAGRLDLCSPEELGLLLAVLSRRMAGKGVRAAEVAPPVVVTPALSEVYHE